MITAAMPSERIHRRIDELLDEIDGATQIPELDRVRALCDSVPGFDHDSEDARSFLAVAEPVTLYEVRAR